MNNSLTNQALSDAADVEVQLFSATQLESLDTPSLYHGKSLSLQEMQEAIEWEATIHHDCH